jgi:short-subunit dehydrogenase
LGVARGCKVFTPAFRAQGGGHIVNIASIAGISCTPMMSSYNASKAAVIALSETLRWKLSWCLFAWGWHLMRRRLINSSFYGK